MRYDALPDDAVANDNVFVLAGNDGMKIDAKRNLYSMNAAGPGEIWITSKEGKHLGKVALYFFTNLCNAMELTPAA